MARPAPVVLVPVRFPLVHQGQDLGDVVARAIDGQGMPLRNNDVVAVASKIVSICENRVLNLNEVRVSARAKRLAKGWGMDERLVSIVVDEADQILGGVKGFLLTIKDGILTANAGVDLKNSPPGTATLWPKSPDVSARRLQRRLQRRAKTRIGLEIVDSRVTALRLGTVGLAIGIAGFSPVLDDRTKPDLYGRKIRVTQSNIADDLAAAAHVLMGERNGKIGAVLIRSAPVILTANSSSNRLKLKRRECVIANNIRNRS